MSSYTTHIVSEEVKIRMTDNGIGALEPTTIPKVFKSTVEKYGNETALHQKCDGKWTTHTWKEYYDKCVKFGKALISLGLKPFQAVNIIGFNSPEWLIADMGAILAGGIAAGIYTTNSPPACQYITEHSEALVVVCDGMKQLEKYVSICDSLPSLKKLVVYNDTIPADFQCKVDVCTFEDFLKLGDNVSDDDINQRMDSLKPGNCSTLIYTSGTTGNPKAVMISHDNALWTAANVIKEFGELSPADRLVSYLPLSHIAAQMLDIFAPLMIGGNLYFAQPDALKGSLGSTLKDVRPTIFFGVPRVWEKIAEKMWALGAQTQGVKKMIATWAKEKGSQKSQLAQYGNSGGAPCGYGCAHKVVLSKIKEALGLNEARACFTGAAPISREVLDYFASLDIPIYELFGQSECSGPQTVNLPGRWKLGTTGKALPGTEMKVVDGTEELIYRGRNIMMGYMKGEQQTKDTIDDDGWLHSGDCGKIDADGFMSITGRIKELIITAGGENVAPVPIEDKMKEVMKAVSNTMVIGDKRKFLSLLITLRVKMDADGAPTDDLDEQALKIAKEIGSGVTKVSQAQSCPKFKEYFDKGVEEANNAAVSRAQRVAKWTLLEKDFTTAGGELTPTLKLKRRVVVQKYETVIEGLYA